MPHHPRTRVRSWLAVTVVATTLLSGVLVGSPATAATTPTPTPTATPSSAASPTPVASPSSTPTSTPSPTSTPTPSPAASDAAAPAQTPSTPPTETPTPSAARVAAATGSISGQVTVPAGITSAQDLLIEVQQVGSSTIIRRELQGPSTGPLTYIARDLPAGEYTVKVSSRAESRTPLVPLWWPDSRTAAGATPVTLAAGEVRTGIDFATYRYSRISGTVTVPPGSSFPVSAVTVEALPTTSAGRTVKVKPANDGTYTLDFLPEASYKVRFNAGQTLSPSSSLVPQYWSGAVFSSDATVITLGRSVQKTGVNAAMQAPASISGTVAIPTWVDRSSGSIRVDVYRAGSTDRLYTDATVNMTNLTYSVGSLPPGSYKLRFVPNGLLVASQWWKGKSSLAEATPIVLSSGQTLTGIDPTLAEGPYSGISGKVTLPAGTSFADGEVRAQFLSADTGSVVREVTVNSDGTYNARPLDPGRYRVKFVAEGVRVFSAVWARSTGSSETVINLGANQKYPGVDITLVGFASITGRVRLPDGVSYRDGQVIVDVYATYYNNVVATAVVSPGGTYVIDGLRAGTYYVKFSSPNLPVKTEWWDTRPDFYTATPVKLAAGGTADITLKLTRSAAAPTAARVG